MGNLLQQMGLQNLESEGLAKQEETADFDPQALCPPDGDMVVTLDKDQIFRDAIKAKPELLPDMVPAAPASQPVAAAKPAAKPAAAKKPAAKPAAAKKPAAKPAAAKKPKPSKRC
jgi:hypothetical protein